MMSSSIRLKGIGLKIPKRSAPTTTFSYSNQPSLRFSYHRLLKSSGSQFRKHECSLQYVRFRIRSMDEDSDGGVASFDWEDGEGTYGINSYISSGEESETELVINPIGDVDLPSSLHERFESSDGALAVTAHRFASLQGRFRMHRKKLVALPAPLGLVCVGKVYGYLTSFCFVSMGNGVNLTDGLDGLAGGTAALSFIGMSITVLPICSDLSIFGVSMAGACIGFLLHNRYKASIFMGDTGSLALGGGLAAMAACTGMFFPLFISSGIFVLEVLSVLMQVSYFRTTKYLYGKGRRLLRMTPLHHHLELCGLKEPLIVTGAYIMSSILAMFAGYVGLISA